MRHKLIAQRRGFALQRAFHLPAEFLFVVLQALLDVFLAVLEHAIDQAGQLVRGCRDRSLAADATLDAPVEQTQRRKSSADGLGRHPESDRYPMLAAARAAF